MEEPVVESGEPARGETQHHNAATTTPPPAIEDGLLPGGAGGVSTPTWVRNWLIGLSVVLGLQTLFMCSAATLMGVAAVPLILMADGSSVYSEDVARQFTYLVQDGDIDGYLELYKDNDASVERDHVRAEFERVLASIDTSASLTYSADQVVRFKDKKTGEKILRMDLAAYNWGTGNSIGRGITLWVLEDELPDIVLTGRNGRDLNSGDIVW